MSKFLTLEGVPPRRASLMDTLIAGLSEAAPTSTAAEREEAFVAAQRKIYDRKYEDFQHAWNTAGSDGGRDAARRIQPIISSVPNEYGDTQQVVYQPTKNYRGETESSNADWIFRAMFKDADKQKSYDTHITSMYASTSGAADSSKLPSNLPPGAGIPAGRYGGGGGGIFASYGIGEALAAQGLDGFSFKRAFTPPRALRRAFRPIARLIKPPSFLKKAIRYGGAIATLPYTAFAGKQRNKMFGLKGNELRNFDIAAKLHRTAQIAVVTVVSAGALSGAGAGAAGAAKAGTLGAGKLGAAGLTKAGAAKVSASLAAKGMSFGAKHSVLAFLGKTAAATALTKGASFLMKDSKSGAVWEMGSNAAGDLISSKFDKGSFTPSDYASMPDNQPMPVPPSDPSGGGGAPSGGGEYPDRSSGVPDPGVAPSVAGADASEYTGEEPTDESRAQNAAPNPLDDDAEVMKTESFDNASLTEMKDSSVSASDDNPEPRGTDDDLSCDFDRALGLVRSRQAGRIRTARATPAALWGSLSC